MMDGQLMERNSPRLKWLASHLRVGDGDWHDVERVGLEMLEAGRTSAAIIELAAANVDSTDLEGLVSQAMEAEGDAIPTDAEAWELVAWETASDVVLGRLSPYRGAARLWHAAERAPELADSLRPFVGMASEWEEDPDHRSQYEDDIVDACRAYVSTMCRPRDHPSSSGGHTCEPPQ